MGLVFTAASASVAAVLLRFVVGAVWTAFAPLTTDPLEDKDVPAHRRNTSSTGSPSPPASPRPRRAVAVIGAGPSGLAFARELKVRGHDVVVYEKSRVVGGAFAHTYQDAMLTSSSIQTVFSTLDHGEEHKPSMWPIPRYQQYLEHYAHANGLYELIEFGTMVTMVDQAPGASSKWELTYHPVNDSSPAAVTTRVFDHIAVCCGAHDAMNLPTWPGQESFAGSIIHSKDYRKATPFTGKRVLVCGLGESASDIILQVAKVASASCLSTRSGPGYVIPRYINGKVTDLDTTRCHHALPRWLGGSWLLRLKGRIESLFTTPEDRRVLAVAEQLNNTRGLPWQRRFGTKNTSFVTAMIDHGTLYKNDIECFRGPNTVVFKDGSTFEADHIICCTGYRVTFPFLPPDIAKTALDIRNLYKHAYMPKYGTSITFGGFVRPGVGSIPPLSELQARFFALAVSGERELPPTSVMEAAIVADRRRELEQFPVDAPRISSLIDYLHLQTDFADLIGCRPPLKRLFFTDIRLWAAVLFGPLAGVQYRIAGPGATPDHARDVLFRMPRMPLPVIAYEAALLAMCKSLSTLGLSDFSCVGV